jgi:hypothetical protein
MFSGRKVIPMSKNEKIQTDLSYQSLIKWLSSYPELTKKAFIYMYLITKKRITLRELNSKSRYSRNRER